MKRCRLAVLASHPIQYFTPIYRRLAAHAAIDLEVMYYRDFGVQPRFDAQFGRAISWDVDQLSGYSSHFLRNVSPITNTFNPLHAINLGAFTRLLAGFDAVWLNGYTYPSNWLALAATFLRRSKLLFRSELRLSQDRRQRWIDPVRDRIIRGWVRRSDALLFIGTENRKAYLHYGAAPDRLFFCPYSADLGVFERARARAEADQVRARRRWGVPADRVVMLFVGKLTSRKHPEAALALAADAAVRERVHLVIAGSGPMEPALRERARSERLDNVTFLGFVNQSLLPDVYAIADVFVMPSEQEPWGLVLNEAMAAGLVPIVSDAVGAAADLVVPEVSGFTFRSGAWEEMRQAAVRLVGDAELRARLAEGARARVAPYDHDGAANGIVRALQGLELLEPERSPYSPALTGTRS